MKIYASFHASLLFGYVFQLHALGNVYNFQEPPITVKIGECVNLTAKSYFSTISHRSKDVEIVWKKDSHKTSDQNAWKYIGYATLKDAAYYEVLVYNKTSNVKETTDFWMNVLECEPNTKESKSETAACKSSCVEMCPSGWYFLQGSAGKKCFKYFSELKTWSAAQDACQDIGAQLAEVENSKENNLIGNLLKTAEGGWIGLNDRSTESTFIWNFDKTKTPSFLSWAKSEPNNFNENCNIENCVMVYKQSGKWSDIICNAFYPFVCESPMRNDSGWTCIAAKCYRFFAQPQIWHDALKTCQSLGGGLASIHSSFENKQIQSIMKSDGWIGLNDITEAGHFVWNQIQYKKEKLQFSNWANNEPNDMVFSSQFTTGCPGEDCVLMKAWQSEIIWYDVHCDTKKPYICEKTRDRLLSSGALIGIVFGSMIVVAVIAGTMNAGMRKRNRAQVKAAMISAYEQDMNDKIATTGSFRDLVQNFNNSRRK